MNNPELHKNLSKESVKNITRWLSEPLYLDYRKELEAMIAAKQWHELEDAFFKVIEFGTGGRRGTTGLGSNRINKITIGESAQALCEYARSINESAVARGVVIACDTRLSSPELSQYAAQVCAANGFKTYLFDSFRSTPELSYSVRELHCAIGIVISASHNPPADNGFKAYWGDGGQLVPPHDKGVLKLAESITEIHTMDYDTAVQEGNIVIVGKELDESYWHAGAAEAVGKDRDISIVYSPLHGAGQTNVLPILAKAGFRKVSVVAEQMIPDGNFPTIKNGKPNPEEKSANDYAVTQLMSEKADIAITNDPDADRIGAVARQGDRAEYLNGNQSAVLATDYVLQQMQSTGTLSSKHYIAKTIVTTDMLRAIADKYAVKTYGNMLVGFKYIGELIKTKENTGETFVIGGEESYGLLKGTYARDKDGASGALLLAECAAQLKTSNKTLYDRMLELYIEHGVYLERLDTIVCPGADGFVKMQSIMLKLRSDPPLTIGDETVTATYDYLTLERIELQSGVTTKIDCPAGNVFVLECSDTRNRFTIRPSGTEPKLKVYVQWYEDAQSGVQQQYEDLGLHLQNLSKILEGLMLMANKE